MSVVSSPPTRKDAARNRARLLRAAERLFATRTDVTLKDVARQADVGVGTVYRHFPTRDDLISALSAERLGDAAGIARTAADDPDGWRGLVQYLEQSMALQAQNGCLRGLVGAGECTSPLMDQTRETITPLIQQMVTKAQQQGTLRPDVDACDIALVQVALLAVLDATRDTSPDRYRHHLDLVLDGMRAEAATGPRPGPEQSPQGT